MANYKNIVKNKKAYHDYHIQDTFESGISLLGTEVKSVRAGKINLNDGWVDINEEGQAFLMSVHISQYSHGNYLNHEEKRSRQLLLKKKEIIKLTNQVFQKGYSIIPTRVFLKNQWIKIEIALAKGKKNYDKRETQKAKDANKDILRAIKNH